MERNDEIVELGAVTLETKGPVGSQDDAIGELDNPTGLSRD